MLILINMTGMKKLYVLPYVKTHIAKDMGWWCLDMKWLFVQINLFNKRAGADMVNYMSNGYKEHKDDSREVG